MAAKTISIDLDAYEKLRRARLTPAESFSMVIKRAVWPSPPHTAGALLAALEKLPVLDEETLDRLDRTQGTDALPEDPRSTEPLATRDS